MATLSAPTLSRLLKEARLVLRQQKASNSTWDDTELTVYANDAVRRYFLEINERAEGQFDAQVDLDIVTNTDTVALPTDCFEVRALYKLNNNTYEIVPYRNNLTDSYDNQPTGSADLYSPYYYFRGDNLVLRPIPGFSQTGALRLEYTQFPETLIWGGDSLGNKISPLFRELIVMYIVYKAKISEDLNTGNSDTSRKAAEHLAYLEVQFKESVGNRSKYPQFVVPFNP